MKIHFIGIGGIGVSALARYYLAKGHKVSGSDLVSSEITDSLKKSGAKISIMRHLAKNLPEDVGLVIYSPAVQSDNPEIKKAKKLQVTGYKLQVLSYPQALGELTKKYFTIAVSGTHGKSTTVAMTASILIKAGLDPTVIVGTKLKEFNGSNFRAGESKYLVIEADEWQASFLNYWPKIIVLTNIEREHLDYYKDLKHILRTYKEYVSHLPRGGLLVVNEDDKNISRIKKQEATLRGVRLKASRRIKKFSLAQKEVKKLREILKVPGEHNIYNALSALTVARALKISDKISFKALSEYKGCWRRFEVKKGRIDSRNFIIISDYAHHPTEVKAALEAAREKFPSKEIWCIFQPHQYQRTFYLFNDFIRVFLGVLRRDQGKPTLDRLIITDIYDVAGREEGEIKKKVSSKKLIKKLNKPWAIHLAKEKVKNYLKRELKGGEIIIIMGAGDVYNLTDEFSTG